MEKNETKYCFLNSERICNSQCMSFYQEKESLGCKILWSLLSLGYYADENTKEAGKK